MNSKKYEPGENHLKELFDQFKFHLIYRNKHTKTQTAFSDQYKDLLAQTREENRVKKAKIRMLKSTNNHRKSQDQLRPTSSLLSKIWKPKPMDEDCLEDLKQNVIVVQKQKQHLRGEISTLEASLSDLKKNVASLRKQVELQTAKVQKYKHISYLSTSIQRNTDTVKIINSRSYKQMLKCQQDTITSLKRFKTALRKQNQELQSKYLQNQNSNQHPTRKPVQSEKEEKEETNNIKIDRKFMASLQELLQLFMVKEEQFEQIKAEQTTKIRLKKIQKRYLKQDRIKWHEMIDRFEDTYDVKTQSLANLIIYIYERLSKESIEMENQCIKRNHIKQILNDDLLNLKQKEKMIVAQERKSVSLRDQCSRSKQEQIFKNSQILLKVVMLFHTLIGKFKYLFTMAITLNKEKKNFHDLLVQIGHMYNPSHILLDCRGEDMTNFQKAVTNFKDMEATMMEQFDQETFSSKEQLLNFIFSDLRYTLIFRKNELEDQLIEGIQTGAVLEKIQNIQNKCDDIYDSKIKIYSMLLINCLKSLSMNKYERKMVDSSKAKDCLFMSIPKTIKIVNLQDYSEGDSFADKECHRTQTKFNSQESQQPQQNFQFDQDPRRIVQMLQKVKNQQKKHFKPLKFSSDQVYMYDRKVVLPKFIL